VAWISNPIVVARIDPIHRPKPRLAWGKLFSTAVSSSTYSPPPSPQTKPLCLDAALSVGDGYGAADRATSPAQQQTAGDASDREGAIIFAAATSAGKQRMFPRS